MEQFIGCDAHKKFSVFVAVNEKGQAGEALRVMHDRQLYREFLGRLPPQSAIAVEAIGHYSWIVDEMESAGHRPKLANALEAKRRKALTKKTDKLDARGLAILLRNGTLPEVWIPPRELRDQRELLRLRIFLVHLRTRVNNRIPSQRAGARSGSVRRRSSFETRRAVAGTAAAQPRGDRAGTGNARFSGNAD